MAEMVMLEATKRAVTGKEVRHLRAQGIIPGVLYGPTFDPISLQVDWAALRPALLQAGGSQIIELAIDGEKYNALVRNVQRTPLRSEVLHIDFYRVRMDVAIRTEVPVVLMGDQTVIEDNGGVLIHEMTSIEVECLPTDLPSEIQVPIEFLKEIGDSILVSGLPELPGVTYLAHAEDVVVTTTYLQRQAEAGEEGAGEQSGSSEPELIRRRGEEDEDNEV